MKTRTQTARSVISILLTLAMMTVMTNSIAGSAGAKEQVEERLNAMGLEEGWDDEKKRYVSIGRAGFDTPHPELDKTFTARQSLAARSAVLEARANIVEYMGFEMVASANAGTVETRAVGQLYGAIPIAQFESWDKDSDEYQVATAVLWSVKMEKLVISAIRGESVRVPPGSLSLEQFVQGFETRPNIGGRFRDDKGVVYILGTGFAAIGGGQSLSTARVLAEQIAREEILMAIYSDISVHTKATNLLVPQQEVVSAEAFERDIVVHTFEGKEEQRVNQQIQKLSGSKLVDPISQQPVYATIFALSLDDYAKSALE